MAVSPAVFGPVPSRRLGRSLGIDLLWPKTCTLNCLYCELGPTTHLTATRTPQRDPGEVLDQVAARLAELDYRPECLTLAGSGEPSLHPDLGWVLDELGRRHPGLRRAVLTNATLVSDPAVRAELGRADLLVPSLDAVSERAFRAVNRPAPGLSPAAMVAGLKALRREFKGEIWLEILLCAGLNDSAEELAGLKAAAREIAPDRVQLNTVVRPPADSHARPVDHERLLAIAREFGPACEVIAPPPPPPRPAAAGGDRGGAGDRLVEMTRLRPLSLADCAAALGKTPGETAPLVEELLAAGRLSRESFGGEVFYRGH